MKLEPPDQALMRQALRMARRAGSRGEVPVGALAARAGVVVARASNATVKRKDPTAHAEVLVLRRAARVLGNHRLEGLTLYVTLEPCLMCLGAM
ncbi:MAG: tRNA-specific adenosine deaminase, partial [Acidobacteria bacterium]